MDQSDGRKQLHASEHRGSADWQCFGSDCSAAPLTEKSRARAMAFPQPGMAGQGDTGAAEQSSRPPPSADSYAAAAEAAAAAAMRLISAHTRVLGEAYVCTCGSLPPLPRRLRRGRGCRPRGWGYHRRARRAFLPDVHLRMSEHDTSGRRPSTRRWRRHRTRCRSPVTQSISKVPVYFGGAC